MRPLPGATFLVLPLVAVLVLSGCTSFGNLLYKAEINGEKATISYTKLNGVREERISLGSAFLYANVEASNQSGSLVVVLKRPDGHPLSTFTIGPKESTKVEQLGPFPKGTYRIEIRGDSAGKGIIKISFS